MVSNLTPCGHLLLQILQIGSNATDAFSKVENYQCQVGQAAAETLKRPLGFPVLLWKPHLSNAQQHLQCSKQQHCLLSLHGDHNQSLRSWIVSGCATLSGLIVPCGDSIQALHESPACIKEQHAKALLAGRLQCA